MFKNFVVWHSSLHGSCSWQTCCMQCIPVNSDVKQQTLPSAGSSGPCLLCLTLARPCSCSVRFGMCAGARRLIAACHDGKVLLLDAPGREEPLTAEDMLLNGASLVSIPATQSATLLGMLCWAWQ